MKTAYQENAGSVAWVGPDVQTAWLFTGLLKNTRWRPVFIVQTGQDAKRFRDLTDATIVVMPDLYAGVVSDVFEKAADLEKEFGVTLLRSMIMPNRHLGRDLMTGAKYFPRSKMFAHRSIEASLSACIASFEFWKDLYEKYPPDLALNYAGGGGITGRPIPLLARKHGFSFRNLSYTRFGNRFYWARDELANAPEIETAFAHATVSGHDRQRISGLVGKQVLTTPKIVSAMHRRREWIPIFREWGVMIARQTYWHLRGYRKAKRGYYLLSNMALRPRERAASKWLKRNCDRDLSRANGRKIVYFALQVEPEMTSLMFGEYRSDQLNLLRELCMSVPADHVVVVKEHPWAVGRRGKDYYNAILSLPNAIFLDPDFPSVELTRKSVAVCSGSSSVNYEAAVLGKLVFHTHKGPLTCLPHAILLDGEASFRRVREALSAPADYREEGFRFFKALEAVSFELGEKGFLNRKTPPTEAEVEGALAALYKSLDVSRSKTEAVSAM